MVGAAAVVRASATAPDQFVLQRIEHCVETVQIGRLHIANHGSRTTGHTSVQFGIAADWNVHQLARHHHRFVHIGNGPRKLFHGEHDALLREFARGVVKRHGLPQRRVR